MFHLETFKVHNVNMMSDLELKPTDGNSITTSLLLRILQYFKFEEKFCLNDVFTTVN